MRIHLIIFVVFSFNFFIPTGATELPSKSQGAPPFWSERWKNIKSPLSTDAKYISYGGTALTLILLANDDQWVDETAEELTENKIMSKFWSKTADNYGKLIPNALYFAGMASYGYLGEDDRSIKRAWMMFEASLYSGVTATILKSTVRQQRPPPAKTKDSFPSGHTTSAFTFASFIQAEHGWYWGSVAYAGALLTAYQRQHNNKHYIHDVVAGATIGAAFGYGIKFANYEQSDLTVLAIPEFDGLRIAGSYDF